MTHREIRLRREHFGSRIFPLLLGRVFHVTTHETLDAILRAGEIQPNTHGAFSSRFGSTNSFFRRRGCISVFDLRSPAAEEVEDHLRKCHPLQVGNQIAFLFLAEDARTTLIPWTLWQDEAAWVEMLVPHIEAGHRGNIPMASIEEILKVTITNPPDSRIERLLEGRRVAAARSRDSRRD